MQKLIALFLFSSIFCSVIAQQKITISNNVELVQLTESVYIHQSYTNSATYGRFSSNGLLLIKNGKAFLVDTPMYDEHTRALVQFINDSLHSKIVLFTGGHFHADCVAGMPIVKTNGAQTVLGKKTYEQCVQHNLMLPDTTFSIFHEFNFEGETVALFYPGAGHASDNIVVYLKNSKTFLGVV